MPVETNLGSVVDADGKPFDGLTALRSDFIAATRFDKVAALSEILAPESRLKQYIDRRIKEEDTSDSHLTDALAEFLNGFNITDGGTDE